MKKYELVKPEKFQSQGLFRIKALKDFTLIDDTEVKKGDLGGIVSGEHNLSQEGDCWIDVEAEVIESARVEGDALVLYDTTIEGEALIKDNAQIGPNSNVSEQAIVKDNAVVTGMVEVSGNVKICEDAHVECESIRHDLKLSGNLVILGTVEGTGELSGSATIIEEAQVFVS